MQDHLISDRPPSTSLLMIILILLILGWAILAQLIGIGIGAILYPGNFLVDMLDPAAHPGLRDALLLAQGIGSILGLILFPIIYLRFVERRNLQGFLKRERNIPLLIACCAVLTIAFAIAISPIVEWNATFNWPGAFGDWARESEKAAEALIAVITGNMTPASFLFGLVVVGVIPGIGEEFMFRGIIQNELLRGTKNHHVAIWATAVLFSAIHFQFLGFFPRVLLGAMLGYLYYWSGNLWVPIFVHFFNNSLQLAGLYLYQQGFIHYDIESTDSAPWPIVGIALMVSLFIFVYLRRYFEQRAIHGVNP